MAGTIEPSIPGRGPVGTRAGGATIPRLTRRQTVLLVASLMAGIALAALDALIVGTAMPTIVGSLGGLSLYAWLVAAYLLTSTTTVPLYGRLADMFGRKPIFVAGIGVFIVGSALCGFATSMPQLILFRALQGLGAGAVMPMAMTIIGDVFAVEQRARMQALFGGVWGVSSIVGPLLGALIVSALSWHWVFFVNVPVGLVAMLLILIVYHERVEHHSRRIDYASGAFLIVGATSLLLALQSTGRSDGLAGAPLVLLYVLSVVCIALFARRESSSADPMVPLALLRRPIIGVSYLVGLLSGLTQFGIGTYVPLFVQGPLGGTALMVGLVIAPMSIGWPIGGVVSGRAILRLGYRRVLLAGMLAIFLGSVGLMALHRATPVPVLMGMVALVGLGMGLSSTPLLVAVQNAVEWNQRGVATALNQFFRTIGGTLGVAVMGSVLNAGLGARLAGSPALAGQSSAQVVLNQLLDPIGRLGLGADVQEALRAALAETLRADFMVAAAAAALGLLAAIIFFPAGSVAEHASEGVSGTAPSVGGRSVGDR